MAIATITREVFTISIHNTYDTFLTYLSNLLVTKLGFTLVDTNSNITIKNNYWGNINGCSRRLLAYNYNNSTKGTVFFDLSCLNPATVDNANIQITDSVDNANNSLSNHYSNRIEIQASLFNNNKLTSGDPIIVTLVNHPEIKGFSCSKGYTGENLSAFIVRPSTKPTWWTESTDLFAFLTVNGVQYAPPNNNILATRNMCTSNIEHNSLNNFVSFNPITELRCLLSGVHIVANDSAGNRGGVIGTLSPDIALVNATGLNINSIIQVQGASTRYQTITKSDNNPVLAVKVVE